MSSAERLLAQAIRTYLPAPLILEWQASPRRPPVWGKWVAGSLMHCDITGFTAMSESLARMGKEGAEVMAAVLNRFFDRMLGLADGWDGQQVKFGGDASLLLFTGRDHAARAGACGLEMQRAMAEFRSVVVREETYRLRMRIGIHSGEFFSASIGDPERMLHYMLVGPDVSRSATVEAAARPGEVVVTRQTAGILRDSSRMTKRDADLFRLQRVDGPPCGASPRRPPGRLPLGRLRRYLPPPLQESPALMESGLLAGEHRRVTAMFINVLGFAGLLARDEPRALAELDYYVARLLELLERYGGMLIGSDVAEHGEKLIALFGAPRSQEQQEANAVRCAVELDGALCDSGSALQHRIGINTGFAFAGEIGAANRREYTVIGDAINLAARLMAAARPGEIVVAASTAAHPEGDVELARMRPFRVKGKTAPVRAFRARGAVGAVLPGADASTPMVGRERELRALVALAGRAARGKARWAHVYGEPGIGKSRLCAELAARLRTQGWTVLTANAYSHTAQAPFAPWLPIFRSLLPDGAEGWQAVRSMIQELAPARSMFAPLVADILSVDCPERAGLASLDSETRQHALIDTLAALLAGKAKERPLLLLLEDLHWVDQASLDLAGRLGSRDDAVLLCVTSREGPPEALRPDLVLPIEPLPADDARQLLAASSSLPPARVNSVVARAQGNPLFLRELAYAGRGEDELPETVNDVVMARVDRLDSRLKSIMRVASVIGPTFDEPLLSSLVEPRVSRRSMRSGLAELAMLGFIRKQPEKSAHDFSHVITRDVVYESLPFAQRRRLHSAVIQRMEAEGPAVPAPELFLHHAECAEDTARVARYSAICGERAYAVFAGQAAIDYYRKSLEAVSRARGAASADRSLIIERIADCQETLGRHREAAEGYAEALEIGRLGARRRPRLISGPPLDAGRQAALCRKIGVSLERDSDYDAALGWLDRAVDAVPGRRPRLSAQVCAAKCVSLFRKGLHEEGIEWGQRALDFARRSRDLREVAYARNMLATCFMERGDLNRAIRHLRQAVRLYHELGDFPGQASANNNLGMCYHLKGTLDAALYHYRVALSADERVGDEVDAAIVQGNVGEVLLALGRIEEAMASLSAVVRGDVQSRADVTGLACMNLSRCSLASGDTEAAERHLRRSRRLLKRVGAEGLLLEAELQRSELLLFRHNAGAALTTAERALRRIRVLRAQLLEARGERILGEASAAAGDRTPAEQHLRASITLARRVGAVHEEARSSVALAREILRGGGSTARAVFYLERAERTFRRMGAEREMREAASLLAGIRR